MYSRAATRRSSERVIFSFSAASPISSQREGGTEIDNTLLDLMRHPRRVLLTLMIGTVSINMFIFAASLSLSETLAGKGSALVPVIGLASPILLTLLGDGGKE